MCEETVNSTGTRKTTHPQLKQIKPIPCFACLQRLLKAKGAKKQAREQPLVSPGDTHALCDQEAVSIVSQISQDSPNTHGFLETKAL